MPRQERTIGRTVLGKTNGFAMASAAKPDHDSLVDALREHVLNGPGETAASLTHIAPDG
jgi:hypothetical protein